LGEDPTEFKVRVRRGDTRTPLTGRKRHADHECGKSSTFAPVLGMEATAIRGRDPNSVYGNEGRVLDGGNIATASGR
jgi:hypothetical protein